MTDNTLLLGAHVSIAGGIEQAFFRGASIDCTTIQYFTHSNRQWKMKPLEQEIVDAAHAAREETNITHDMVHASYLINVASSSSETRKKSFDMLGMELEHCARLGVKLLILHPGSRPATQEGLAMVSEALNTLFNQINVPVTLLLENTAGQGSTLGSTFEELATIKEGISQKERIGFCLDTCHLWAAGYDFSTTEGYTNVWTEFDRILGIQNLKALHVNDSKKPLNAHVDRHENIGQGTIGTQAFSLLMNDKRLKNIPKIVETPGTELSEFAQNMAVLKSLLR